ncbi:MFS transporter [Staphylococcus ureilyticus]|uniref:MFS transporter n=1 Tax=Staphylococcus ureilyticus TaxID=94138 RepID=UPI00092A0FA8|nr:MFS transporter [Staphylococcus ureilyticus]MCT1914884.1 MFS transporter [Staphylococcus ureilyticus]OJT32851.1 hypothetical protein BSF33_11050 [Staphylococcus ureilyticus]RNM25162.1 MFS transporter [Staphylococcus cohnii]
MNKKVILFTVLGSYFLIMMDTSITMTALNEIKKELHMNSGVLTWVQSAYVLLFGGLLLIGSKIGDTLGLKKVFLIGLHLFMFFSITTGLANNSWLLIISRAGQGIAAALVSPSILAFINTLYDEGSEKRKIVSFYSAIAGIGASGGMLVGGILTWLLSWRFCFLINIPLCLLFIILAFTSLPKITPVKRQTIDILGTILSVCSIILMILGMERMSTNINLINTFLIVIGVILLGIFIMRENNVASPIINLNLFKNKLRSSGYFLRFLFLCTSFSFWYYMSIYLQSVFHLSPITTGSLLIFTTGFNFITALNIHKLLERKTNISLLIQGIIISIIGMVTLALCIYYHSQIILFIPSLILIGIGQGFIFTPLTNLGMHNISTDQSGIASGLVNFSHQIGSSTGVVFELVLATFILSYTGEPHDNLTFYTIVIGTVIQFLMLAYIIIVFKKSKNKYEF